MGYYSRCRNLIFTAKQIVASSNGLFPDNYADLLKLKGIGTYTAAAIASFAYNQPYAVVDGNVYRVLSRAFGIKTPIDTTEGKKEFEILANKLLDKKQAAVYNQAIIDFGASVCKPANPLCESCVFQSQCFAYKHHEVNYYPQKVKKKKPKNRYFHFAVCELKGKYAVKQRTEKDIWKGLYEFPNIEAPASTDKKRMASLFKEQFGIRIKEPNNHHPFVQKLTHQTIYAHVYSVQFTNKPANLAAYQWLTLKQIAQLPFPKIINDIKATVL